MILVVDDNAQNRLLAKAHLESEGYVVATVGSGLEALEHFARVPSDLVLLDIQMPGIDGFETCRRLRALPQGASTPIVFLTAHADLDSHKLAIAAGGDDFLSKPIQRIELLIRVRSLVRIKRMQTELIRSNEVVAAQRDALVKARDARKALSAMIVHDLKSPLTTILADGEYLLMTAQEPEAQEVLAQVVKSVNLMHRMVLDLLDVERSEDGTLVPRYEPIDLEELVSSCVQPLRRRMTRAHDVTTSFAPDARVLVADRELLRRVLDNLLDNAAKYAPTGEDIRVVTRSVDDARLELRIEDSGPGVPEALREAIFEPYKRIARDQHVDARSSRGLGLAFCRLAIEAHGGALWVEDNVPVGSAFCILVPRAPEVRGATPT